MSNGKRRLMKVLAGIVILGIVCGVGVYILHTHTIKNVYVEGNVHYTQEEIKTLVMDGPLGDNSLYLSMKYRNKDITDMPFVDVMNVEILSPDTIKITVYEKALAGYVTYMDTYMYFDKDGYVVESSNVKTVGIPQITGLTFDHVILGELLPVEDAGVFNRVMNITKLMNKYELAADKIYFHSSGEITVYFGEVKVALGSEDASLEDKVMRLPVFLPELDGKAGTLQMEKYDENSGKFTFKPDVE